ncbi:MAG: hypothetical protein HY760_05215, partial [Nitrospirae bacterium]|nr:hypothetical protein [Nitrospirota bacterium]
NDSLYPTLHAGFSDFAVGYADLWDTPQEYSYWERRQRLDLDVILPRSAFRIQQSLTLGYRTEWLSALSGVPPGGEIPAEGRLAGLRIAWRFSTAKEYGFSISREEGRLLQASYIHFDHQLGSDFDQNRYVVAWHEYPELFRRHHVLGVRLTGGAATGDRMVQRAFQVGGPTLAEVFLDPDQTEFPLRGYPARLLRGQKAAAGTVEYRIPLYNVERGVGTWPFFFRRVHAALFYDVGNAWDNDTGTSLSDFRGGIGSEIKTDMIFGHRLPLRLRLGLAEGLDAGGEKQVYFTVGDSF